MKVCTNKYCNNEHNTKYNFCPDCRRELRDRRRKQRGYKWQKILDICEDNPHEITSWEILKILNKE